MSLNLKQLEAFRAVMTTGSASAAAKDLHVSQPAISRLLAQMENELGVELFHREKGRLLPTVEATALLGETHQAFNEIQRLLNYAVTLRGEGLRQIRIASPTSISLTILPDIVEAFVHDNPGISFVFLTGEVNHVEVMLSSGQADLGFLRLPTTQAGLSIKPLAPIPAVCVLAADHPLAAKESISPRDLQSVPLIIPNRFRPSRVKLESVFAKAGCKTTIQYETTIVVESLSLAARGLGVAICNELMGSHFHNAAVVSRPFNGDITYEYALAKPSKIPASKLAERFFDAFENYVSPRKTDRAHE